MKKRVLWQNIVVPSRWHSFVNLICGVKRHKNGRVYFDTQNYPIFQVACATDNCQGTVTLKNYKISNTRFCRDCGYKVGQATRKENSKAVDSVKWRRRNTQGQRVTEYKCKTEGCDRWLNYQQYKKKKESICRDCKYPVLKGIVSVPPNIIAKAHLIIRYSRNRGASGGITYFTNCAGEFCSNEVTMRKRSSGKYLCVLCGKTKGYLFGHRICSSWIWSKRDKIVKIEKSKGSKDVFYKIRCVETDCHRLINLDLLRSRKVARCASCSQRKQGRKDFRSLYNKMLSNNVKEKVKLRGRHLMKLSWKHFSEVVALQNCFYCGNFLNRKIRGTGASNASLLDRLDTTRPYEKGNVAPCCNACNRTKGHLMTAQEMLAFICLRRKEYEKAALIMQEKTLKSALRYFENSAAADVAAFVARELL